MARSAALNPASMPFFPGGIRGNDDERGNGVVFSQHVFREQDRASLSSHSVSPSDYLSVRSSPSPPQAKVQDPPHQPSPAPRENQRQSPTIRQIDAGKAYPALEVRPTREASMLGTLGTLTEREDTQSPEQEEEDQAPESGHQTPGSTFYSLQQPQTLERLERLPSLPFAFNNTARGSVSAVAYTSPSPVSSQDSNGRTTSSVDLQMQTFEAQLKASPMIHDILDRLVRCEYNTREIQRDLGDISRKVNLLVERALGTNGQPEFKDPFSTNGPSVKPRPSIGNIAPNQAANADDISSISQRLNTLTSSVGQLLALQTQQMQQTVVPDSRNNSVISLNTSQMDLAPNQILSPTGGISSSASILGHGLPNRPGPRQPNPPMRTWSAGNIELPVRPPDQGLGRQEALLRDKRRSVTSLLRRDSSGVSA